MDSVITTEKAYKMTNNYVYVAVEEVNEGYDCTQTLKTIVFATEKGAISWVSEIKNSNYLWRDYEKMEVIQ